MTMATRCPACGTVFRVVQDQLRVSAGWVRCGRCGEAFDAAAGLVDLDAAHRQPVTAPPPPMPADGAATQSDFEETEAARVAEDSGVAAPAVPAPPPAAGESELTAPPADDAMPRDELRERPAAGAAPADDEPQRPGTAAPPPAAEDESAQHEAVAASADEKQPALPSDSPAAAAKPPSFLRRAERAERWRRPWVRALLGTGVLVAAVALVGQAAYLHREWLAASLPGLRPWLAQACAAAGCEVPLYRQLESLTVESSGLVRVDGTALYRLAVVLRNRSALEVAAPSIDLVLTDAQGRLIARRVLSLSDLGVPVRSLKAGSELPIQASLGVGERAVSGYTVEIFYP